jgi:hypothetical protein
VNNFYHSGAAGDIIYSLPTVIAKGGGKLLVKNLNKFGKRFYEYLARLLTLQPYLSEVSAGNPCLNYEKHLAGEGMFIEYEGVNYYNLDMYRWKEYEMRKKEISYHLAQIHLDIFGLSFDLSQPWLFNVSPLHAADIVVNRTKRYHDKEEVDWSLLKPYQERTVWIGKRKEYWRFVEVSGLQLTPYICGDLLDVAQAIKGSKLFIGNQSACFAVAEAMKVPRVLEVCYNKDNCRPNSDNGYTFLSKDLIERYLNE